MRTSPLPRLSSAFFAVLFSGAALAPAQEESSTAAAALEAAKAKAKENSDLLRMAQDRFNSEIRTRAPAPAASPSAAKPAAPVPSPAPVAVPAAAATVAKPLIPEPVAAQPAPTPAPAPAANTPGAATDQPLLSASGVPAPRPPAAKYTPQATPAAKGMQITSQRSVMDDKAHMVVFSGDVVVVDATFHMECDKLEIQLYADGEEPVAKEGSQSGSVKKAIATGGMVIIERLNEKGEKEIAKSTMAIFDSATNETILTGGPPILQQGGTTIEMLDPSGKIFLSEDGKNRTEGRVTINMGRAPGQGKGNGLSNLNNITGSKR